MIPLSISPDLKAKVPGVAVGWITAAVRNRQHDEALWHEIDAAARRFHGMTMEEARKFPPIKALRDAYRALGNDPTLPPRRERHFLPPPCSSLSNNFGQGGSDRR